MLIDATTAAAGSQRNPEESNFPSGVYLSRLLSVSEIGPKADDERKTPRLVFEFEVADGPYRGKKAATFVFKKLYPKPAGRMGKASKLYELAKSFGVLDPMAGFDTDQFVGKHYQIGVKNEGDRAWVESVFPAAAPATAPNPGTGTGGSRPAPPPPRPKAKVAEPADDSGWMVHAGAATGDDWQAMNGGDVKKFLAANVAKSLDVVVCPESGGDPKPPAEYGFVSDPF